jgi:predicted ABC-type transport system involved in lysophospholipase L1 biosynthesis ATPase subunit
VSAAAAAARGRADLQNVALWYEPPPDGPAGRVWIPMGGEHRATAANEAFKSRLLGAVLELKAQSGARLAVLGREADALAPRERAALRARVAFLPGAGGLISNLNAWENIALPLGYHAPRRLRGLAPKVYALLEQLGVKPRTLLAKLPEDMTLFEKKLAGYVRMLIEEPDLVLAENLADGLESEERRRAERFGAAYLAQRPGGTFVRLDDAHDAPEE